MEHPHSDTSFAGAVPQVYESLLVPLIFEPYAIDVAARLAARPLTRVLEVAAGTGVVTRHLATMLPASVAIVATDLNEPMLEQARAIGTGRPVEWRQADAMKLPFADASFDAVVCQFGVMFFPDKAAAFAETRRVLMAGGVFMFSVWDRIEENEFADTVTAALQDVYPDDPPRFLARTPHGYSDPSTIVQDLAKAGFTAAPRVTTVAARSRAASARLVAMAYCLGTPLRNEFAARDATRAVAASEAATAAIARRFGTAAVEGKIQAHVVCVEA
jgi:ubiquinone/menaquinone biosynthesis C-methylase UbiE